MKEILAKCTNEDFKYLSQVLNSPLSFTNDKKRKKLLSESETSEEAREQLIELIDKKIGYYGSADVVYVKRRVLKQKPGVPDSELIHNICKKLNITIKEGGSIEAKLGRVAKAIVEEELMSKSPEQLVKELEGIGVGAVDIKKILESIEGKTARLPELVKVLGPEITLRVAETIVVSLGETVGLVKTLVPKRISGITENIAAFSRKADEWVTSQGQKITPGFSKKNTVRTPWDTLPVVWGLTRKAIGFVTFLVPKFIRTPLVTPPVLWGLTGAWLVYWLQQPALRKTVPVVFFLGVVALRDGEEEKLT